MADSRDRFARVEKLFHAALALPEDRRGAYLDEACAGDETLRAEVERLLKRAAQETERGIHNPIETTLASGGEELAGRSIGPYRILEKLGEGGMGEVWLAEQTQPVRRKVALKVIKPGMDSGQVLARFEAERQALAMMEHPAIASIFDAGTTDSGRPYFVMEYVAGVPLTEYCDRNRLTNRQRLELFVQVCEGVQHAHQKAVIHRDLKPSNVLVAEIGDRPTPKIIDFGVAKAAGPKLTLQTLHTQLGLVIGTPAYMSPEQAGLDGAHDVDTRTDVYALGVMLYELLVGALPLDPTDLREAGLEAIMRHIREDEPPRPSARLTSLGDASTESARCRRVALPELRRELVGDLDWISLKSLEKDRARRYGSPMELAADIERYLSDRPVLASPPSVSYRLRKLVRRNRAAAVAGVVVAVALVLGAIGLTAGLLSAQNAERTARLEADRANAISDYLLRDMLAAASPWKLGREARVVDLLSNAQTRLPGLEAEQPEVALTVGHTIGVSLLELGLHAEAIEQLEASLSAAESLHGPDHPDAALIRFDLGRAYRFADRIDEGTALIRDARDHLQDHLELTDPRRFKIEAVLANVPGMQQENTTDSVERVRAIATEAEQVLGLDHPETMDIYNALLSLLNRNNKLDEAEALGKRLVAHRESTGTTNHPGFLALLGMRAETFRFQRDYDSAEAIMRDAIERTRRLVGDDHMMTLIQSWQLGAVLNDADRPEESAPMLQELIPKFIRVTGADSQRVSAIRGSLAVALRRLGRYDEAKAEALEVLEINRRTLNPDDPRIARAYDVLGAIHFEMDEFDEAAEAMSRGVEIYGESLGTDHFATLDARYNLAVLYRRVGRFEDAFREFEALVEPTTREYGDAHQFTGDAHLDVGRARLDLGSPEAALADLERAREVYRRALPEDHGRHFEAATWIGRALSRLKRYDAALEQLTLATEGQLRRDRPERAILALDEVIAIHEARGDSAAAAEARNRRAELSGS